MDDKNIIQKSIALILVIIGLSFLGKSLGFNMNQNITVVAFSLSILGTLLFWQFRLSFAFIGTALILFTGVTKMSDFIRLSSMEIIFFLIGMMIIAGFLKEIGFFVWLVQKALIMKNISAKKFTVTLIFTSALLACVVDEVSSIIFMLMIVFELCDYFDIKPVPFVMASVLATNIGSSGTVMGNPIGLFIATKAPLTFEDFLLHSFPLMIASLLILVGLLFLMFKKELGELDTKIRSLGPNEILIRLLSVPPELKLKIAFLIFGSTVLLIAMHHRLEVLLGLETNTVLLIAPLCSAAVIMIWRRHKAREYIEKDVEWWSLLFFVFLFAQAGILSETGVAEAFAGKLLALASNSKPLLMATVLFSSGIISSVLDNVVVVAGFSPIIHSLTSMLNIGDILWWALLFGACFGGNMTIIGSTANIVAIGIIEKQKKMHIGFFYWLKIGSVVTIVTLTFILLSLLFIPHFM